MRTGVHLPEEEPVREPSRRPGRLPSPSRSRSPAFFILPHQLKLPFHSSCCSQLVNSHTHIFFHERKKEVGNVKRGVGRFFFKRRLEQYGSYSFNNIPSLVFTHPRRIKKKKERETTRWICCNHLAKGCVEAYEAPAYLSTQPRKRSAPACINHEGGGGPTGGFQRGETGCGAPNTQTINKPVLECRSSDTTPRLTY